MSIGFRHFIFEDDGTMLLLPQRVSDGLVKGTDRLPQFAGRKMRMVTVILALDEGEPQKIERIQPTIIQFDELGNWQFEPIPTGDVGGVLDRLMPPKPAGVVDITDKLARQRYVREHQWQPTDADVTRIVDAIWPEQAGRPVVRPPLAQGAAKRRLPLTHPARRALSTIQGSVAEISIRLEALSEKDLRSFVDEARERQEPTELVDFVLWEGIIAAAEKQLQIVQARKSPRGIWFAAIERETEVPDYAGVCKVEILDHRECKGRSAAVAAAREMLAKHADLFDVGTEIRARLCPAIEWQGP